MNIKKILLLNVLLCTISIQATVLIITHAFNRPDFIAMQHKLFKKFLQDDYRFVVFNDANTSELCLAIEKTCESLGIECRRVPQEIHTRPYLPRVYASEDGAAPRHADCVQYSMDTFGFEHHGTALIIDSDMFLVRPFSIERHMQDYEISAILRTAGTDYKHLWPGLCMLALDKMPNVRELSFARGFINSSMADVGGFSYYYLKKYPSVRIKEIFERWSYELGCNHHQVDTTHVRKLDNEEQKQLLESYGFNEREIKFIAQRPDTFEFECDNHFFHYRAGTNYDNHLSSENIKSKTVLIEEYFSDILERS